MPTLKDKTKTSHKNTSYRGRTKLSEKSQAVINGYRNNGAGEQTRATIDKYTAALLHAGGMSIQSVAKQMGRSPSTTKAYIDAVLDKLAIDTKEKMDRERTKVYQALNKMHSVYFGPAIAGDQDAAKLDLNILQEMVRIYGLDAPVKLDINDQKDSEVYEVAVFFRNKNAFQAGVELAKLMEAGTGGHSSKVIEGEVAEGKAS